jgi:DNA-binding Lrp family transcriptional regulator
MVTDRLPKTSLVQSISSHTVLRRYPLVASLPSDPEMFTPAQRDQLKAFAEERFSVITERERDERSTRTTIRLDPDDHKIVSLLEGDARMPYAKIADVLGWMPARAAHRIRELVDSGVMYLDLDVSLPQLGVALAAIIWGKVPVRELDAAGTAVGTIPEVPFVCATTGTTNLMASVLCRDTRHLYEVMTMGFGEKAGIDDVEVSPVVRRVKQARAFVNAGRVQRLAVH